MRWFMTLAYRGAPFHGWQVQPGEETVQGRLESALSTLVRRPVAVTAPDVPIPESMPPLWWRTSTCPMSWTRESPAF